MWETVVERELLEEEPVPSPVVRTAIVGATGYVGRELIAQLARHPGAHVARPMRPDSDLRPPVAAGKRAKGEN